MNKNRYILFFALVLLPFLMMGQAPEAKLAEKYFQDGEYQSALNLFSKLQKKDQQNRGFVQRMSFCFGQLEQFDNGLSFMDKVMRKNPMDHLIPFYKIDLLKLKGDFAAAESLENKTIERDLQRETDFLEVGGYLYTKGQNKLALKTYQQARKTLNSKQLFSSEIANLYSMDGEYTLAAQEYLKEYDHNIGSLNQVKINLLNLVSDQSKDDIEQVLLTQVQKRSQDLGLRTIVFQFYVLTENFYEALIQCKSIDKVFRENGSRVYNYAVTLRNNKKYKLSNKALDYIIENHEKSPYRLKAFQQKTVNNELQAFEVLPLNQEALLEAVRAYEALLQTQGRKAQLFDAMYRKANLQAFYLFDLPGAKAELDKLLALGLPRPKMAKASLLYGDILLMQKSYNKAKLRYNQVAEDFKEGQIGAGAKFKQGQLAYFKGDFEYSQARLKTIKDNTSNDISNDAIKLFLLIQDNIGLDTTTLPLERFAQAQLRVFQRDFQPAVELLDSILYAFPNHGLTDDILWEKANIYDQKQDLDKTMLFLNKIIEGYPEDIHGDDALFRKAQIYDYNYKNKDEAMKLYIQFLRNYSGSLYIVSVRKRIRELRDDQI